MYKFMCKSCDAILTYGHVIDFCPVCKSRNLIELIEEEEHDYEEDEE